MKKSWILLACLWLMASCEDEMPEPLYRIETHAYYMETSRLGDTIPDAGAKVFVYYDLVTADLLHYTYAGDGVFEKAEDEYAGEEQIFPDLTDTIDASGMSVITIPPEHIHTVTTFIESYYYSPRIESFVYPSIHGTLKQTIVFKP